jgi:hypothetical protein
MHDVIYLPGALANDDSIRFLHLRVVLALKRYTDERTGRSCPGQERLASDLNIDVRSVRRATREMESLLYLTITREGHKTVYTLAERFRCPPRERRDETPSRVVTPLAARRVQVVASAAPAGAPEPDSSTAEPDSSTGQTGLLESLERRERGIGKKDIGITESPAARARTARFNRSGQSPARSARPEDEKRKARENWIHALGQFVRECLPNEYGDFWMMAISSPEEARPTLNRLDRLMRKSPWWAARAARPELRQVA